MSVAFNHTIVHCSNKRASATFLCQILGLSDPTPYGPFLEVHAANGVSLDYADDNGFPSRQHYAFLVDDDDFDAIHGRIVKSGLTGRPSYLRRASRTFLRAGGLDGCRALLLDER